MADEIVNLRPLIEQGRGQIRLPVGATLLDVSEFRTSMYIEDDTPTERVVFGYNGHQVQIIRYSYDDARVVVVVDERMEVTDMQGADRFIGRHAI